MKIKNKSELNILKDFELKSLAKSIGHPAPGNKSNMVLREYLTENFERVIESIHNEENSIQTNQIKGNWIDRNRTLIFFILSAILSIYLWRKANIEDPMIEDFCEIPITLIYDSNKKRLVSMTYFSPRQTQPVEFENYESSLNGIDKIFYSQELKSVVPKNILAPDNVRHLVEYAFWWWLTDFPQSYYLIKEKEPNGVQNRRGATLEEIDFENPTQLPSNGNPFLDINPPLVFLPTEVSVNFSINQFEIESKYSKITFGIRSMNGGRLSRRLNEFSEYIYTYLNIENDHSLHTVSTSIELSYKYIGKNLSSNSKESNKERDWYLRIKENAIKDFSYTNVKKTLLEQMKTATNKR